jgi:hypothetical protein
MDMADELFITGATLVLQEIRQRRRTPGASADR